MQTIAHEGARVETGAVQFGDDWPGVFIRGDNAFALAMPLQALLDGRDDPLTRAQVGGLLSLLRSSNVHADARPLESQSAPTPAADEVEAVARAIARRNYPNGTPSDIEDMADGFMEDARAAIAAMQARSAATNSAEGRASTFAACPQEKPNREAASRPSAEPAGEEPLVWSVRRKGTHEMVWDDGGFIAASKEEAEHFAGYFVNHEAFPLYAHPAPSNPERLVEALRQADVDFQRTPGTNRDGAIVKHVRESRARIAFALSAAPLKEGSLRSGEREG